MLSEYLTSRTKTLTTFILYIYYIIIANVFLLHKKSKTQRFAFFAFLFLYSVVIIKTINMPESAPIESMNISPT